MSLRFARRFLATLAVPCVLVCFGNTPTLALDDEHAHAAAHDDHATAPKAEPKPAAKPEPKTEAKPDAKSESKPATMRAPDTRRESKPESSDSRPEPKATKAAPVADVPMTAEAALKALQDGNQRWVSDKDENPNTEPARRAMLTEKGQKPFCSILTCADSRLPVERIFDRGVGELFVVRVAGNTAGTSETGTLEYAVEHLKTPLIVVMGHTKCGAVAAAASGAELHGALGELVGSITPAVDRVKRNNPDADEKQLPALAVRENVWQSITDLFKRSPEVRAAVAKGDVKVIGAVCDIATGKVDWMGEHPWQSELVEAFNVRAARTAAAAPREGDENK